MQLWIKYFALLLCLKFETVILFNKLVDNLWTEC